MQIGCKLCTNEAQLYSVAEKNIFCHMDNKRRISRTLSNQKWLSEGFQSLQLKRKKSMQILLLTDSAMITQLEKVYRKAVKDIPGFMETFR